MEFIDDLSVSLRQLSWILLGEKEKSLTIFIITRFTEIILIYYFFHKDVNSVVSFSPVVPT